MERINERILALSCGHLNRRAAKHGAFYRYQVYYGNGKCELQRIYPHRTESEVSSVGEVITSYYKISGVIKSGTKREIYEFIYAMQTALDDIEVKAS